MWSLVAMIVSEVLKEVIRVVFARGEVSEVGVMDDVLSTPIDDVLSRARGGGLLDA